MTASWVPMMAAMMLPSAVPASARRVREHDDVLVAPPFAGSYLVVRRAVGAIALIQKELPL